MTKQALIDHERMIRNIISVYRDADEQHAEGLLWYSDAQKAAHDIAVKYDMPVYLVVAVIAALSPNNKWSRILSTPMPVGAFIRGDGSVCQSFDLQQDETKGLGYFGGASGPTGQNICRKVRKSRRFLWTLWANST